MWFVNNLNAYNQTGITNDFSGGLHPSAWCRPQVYDRIAVFDEI
jgi:hypothetical protein